MNKENIFKNRKMVAKLSDPNKNELSILNSIVGIIPSDHLSVEEAKMERILRRAFLGEGIQLKEIEEKL